MQTQCPQCHAIFRITSAQLKAAQGMVRCGQCQNVFDGYQYVNFRKPQDLDPQSSATELSEQLEALARTGHTAGEAKPPDSGVNHEERRDTPQDTEPDGLVELVEAERVETIVATEITAGDIPEPFLLEDELTGRPHRAWLQPVNLAWSLAALVMLALLAGQYLWHHRLDVMRNPDLAPLLMGTCEILGCRVGPLRAPERITMLSRNVYSHPNSPDALMITGSLRNDAPFEQPYPELQLTFSDLQGTIVAARRFRPEEYLVDATRATTPLEPGASAPFSLEIADPGTPAFEFDFI